MHSCRCRLPKRGHCSRSDSEIHVPFAKLKVLRSFTCEAPWASIKLIDAAKTDSLLDEDSQISTWYIVAPLHLRIPVSSPVLILSSVDLPAQKI